mgnify:CR=1 FL=1
MKDLKFKFPIGDKILVSIYILLVVWLIYDNMHSPQKDPIQLTIIALFMGVFAIRFKELAKYDMSLSLPLEDAEKNDHRLGKDIEDLSGAVLGVGGMFFIYQYLTSPYIEGGTRWLDNIYFFGQPIFQFFVIFLLAVMIGAWTRKVSWEIKSMVDVALIASLIVMHISYLSIAWTTMPGWGQFDHWFSDGFSLVQSFFTIGFWIVGLSSNVAESFDEAMRKQ